MNIGTVRLRYASGLMNITALFVGWLFFNRIDTTTRLNTAVLIQHSEKLAKHDSQLDAIFEGKFSLGFLSIIKKDLHAHE